MIRIAPMARADLAFAHSLTMAEGWGYYQDDLARLLDYQPDGCFVARVGGARAGIVTTTAYGDYAFLGTLIVHPDHRGRGLGERLMRHAMRRLQRLSVRTIELDGVMRAVPLYRRLGFVDKYLSLRFFRKPLREKAAKLRPAPFTLDEILAYDLKKTGIARERVLARLMDDYRDSCFVLGNRAINAYAIVRRRETGFHFIGPLIADNAASAERLLLRIMASYSTRPLSIAVPAINTAMVSMARKHGFLYNPPALRMYWGDRRDYERHTFGVLSPEKG